MESTSPLEKGKDVLGTGIEEDLTLEQLGYHQGMGLYHRFSGQHD